MATERKPAQGPGGVRWMEERGMYRARVRLPNKTRPTAYFKTEGEGWAWIHQTVRDAERGHYIVTNKRKTSDVLNEWLTDVAPRNLRPNSLYNYRLCLGYVLPSIGSIRLTELTRPTIERVFTQLERGGRGRNGLSASTLNLTFRILKMALEYCEDVGYLDRNPMRNMTAPSLVDADRRVLTVDELRMLLGAVRGSRWEAAYWLLATTGMRVSEVLGLEWSNVDLETGHIRIEQQTGRVYGQSGVELVPLKSRTSRREPVVPTVVCTILRWHEDRQRLERRRAEESGGWEEHGTVFANPAGKLYYRSRLEDDFRAVTAQLGLVGVTPHTLRHTAATLVQEAGTSLKTAQALLGHATERMTLRVYSHRTASSLEAVALTMERLLGDVSVVQPSDDLTASETTGDTSGDHPGDQTVTDTA